MHPQASPGRDLKLWQQPAIRMRQPLLRLQAQRMKPAPLPRPRSYGPDERGYTDYPFLQD